MLLDDLKYHLEKSSDELERLQRHIKELTDERDYWRGVALKQKPYEKEAYWKTEDVADYFRLSSAKIINAVKRHKIKAVDFSLEENCKRPTFRFKREDIYEMAKAISIQMKS